MKLSKAIEILTHPPSIEDRLEPSAFMNAVKLGIEALEFVRKLRYFPFPDEVLQLPGETPEQEAD
uniref:Uncharacterized protein n=1 Tax=viral metagenome TaxID=1070528 RepID=A0A6M3M090_9ZZZZ